MTDTNNTFEPHDNDAMEMLEPPVPWSVQDMPQKAPDGAPAILSERFGKRQWWGLWPAAPSIGLAAARFTESCEGGGYFCNNCASEQSRLHTSSANCLHSVKISVLIFISVTKSAEKIPNPKGE